MKLIIPQKLKPSSTVAFVSIAGEITNNESIDRAEKYFKNRGFLVKKYLPEKKCAYLGGTDSERLDFLHNAFADKTIDAIIALRGGYGALRLINKIDWQLIKNNPKIFAGFSDITALLLMIYKKTGLMTFHAPMVCSDFGADITQFSADNFFDTLQNGFSGAKLEKSNQKARGILWGGNLSTVASLCGTDFLPEEDFLFFTEDVNEPVYKIDRMFTQLTNIAAFRKHLKAIIVGDFSGLDSEENFVSYIKSLSLSLGVPVFFGLKTGHERDKLTLPVGLRAEINGSELQ